MRRLSVFAVVLLVVPAFGAGPADAVTRAARDLSMLPEQDHEHQGYFWNPQPIVGRGAAVSLAAGLAAELADFDAVLRFHVNQLSLRGSLTPPARVDFDLWRVDLRHYKWDRKVWDKMAKRNAYFNEQFPVKVVRRTNDRRPTTVTINRTGPASWLPLEPIKYLIEQTGSKTPIVSAPWFLANTCRQFTLTNEELGYGYYDWLGVKNRNDFFNIAAVRLKETRERELDILEVMAKSGVSKQNRRINAERTIHGWLLLTEDTNNQSGKGNAVQNLKRGDYVHQAEEHYLPLANGLPAYLLCDANGAVQTHAPDFIGPDKSPLNQSTDGRIHVCLACIRCHAGNVLQPIKGWARSNYTIGRLALNVPSLFRGADEKEQFELFEELSRQYLRLNISNAINEQRESYRRAMREISGLDSAELSRRFARAYHQYADVDVGLDQAARELGYQPEHVRAAFKQYSSVNGVGGINSQLGSMVLDKDPDPIPREQWESFYAEAQRIMMTYKPEAP